MPIEGLVRAKRLYQDIWTAPPAQRPPWQRRAMHIVRIVAAIFRDALRGDLTLWTMSLVYTTLLSMVPLLALSFSVLKAFGVHNQIGPFLENVLAPLGEQGDEITKRLIGFIEHLNVGVLGAVGLALLLYTVVSLMQKIEEAFNSIWRVPQLRSFADRFSRYLSTLLVGPILIFSAIGITALAFNSEFAQSIMSIRPFGEIFVAIDKLIPFVLVIGAFTFLYVFVPNTRVRLGPALTAGVVAGALWQSAGWAFAAFVASSTRYAAIYSSFAILILFLIWLYVSWLVLLIGASVSFYLQEPEYLYAAPGEPRLSNRMRERLALAIVYVVATDFVRGGEPPWTLHRLTRRLAIPMHSVNAVVDALITGGLLIGSGHDPPAYVPARDLSHMSIADVLATVRSAGEDRFLNPNSLPLPEAVEGIVARVDRAIASSSEQLSVESMVENVRSADARRNDAAAASTRSGTPQRDRVSTRTER
jgi:membrane protein